jgi:hypothetical protein
MQYRLVSLTPALSFIPCASDGRDRRLLYSAFTAASVLQDQIQGDVDSHLTAIPRTPAIKDNTHRFPAISELRRYGSPLAAPERLKFQIRQRHHDIQNYRWLYFAETEDSQTILVKFVRQYSVSLHAFCSDSGHAPHILAYEKLPGGWQAIAMEFIVEGVPITKSRQLATYRQRN